MPAGICTGLIIGAGCVSVVSHNLQALSTLRSSRFFVTYHDLLKLVVAFHSCSARRLAVVTSVPQTLLASF
ncbi:hypothetical protein ABKN59_001408 [Abortiporus biennis]